MSTLKTDYILDSAGGNNAQINGMIPVGTTSVQTLTNKTLSNVTLTGTVTANSSVGTAGQVLTSNGTVAYWSTLANTNLVSSNVANILNGTTAFTGNIRLTAGINANSSVGTAGQVLTSNGTVAYWSTPVTTGKAIAMAIVFGG